MARKPMTALDRTLRWINVILREAAGIAVLLKLLLVGWMIFDAAAQQLLFWLIVAGSAVAAHAPARFRHAILIGHAPH